MNENKTNINWYPGHMAKAKREISEKLNLIDIVYEVVDARMPFSSRIVDLDKLIKDKPHIIIMSKYDLCDKQITDLYIKKYGEANIEVLSLDLTKTIDINKLNDISQKSLHKQLLNRKNKGLINQNIRGLIVGAPNVGKSTFINRLANKKIVEVGNKPGVTKALGWIKVSPNLQVLDTPGVLWPKLVDQEQALVLAAFSSIKEEIVDDEQLSNFIINKMEQLYPNLLAKRYNLDDLANYSLDELYQHIGKKRGCLQKGGIVDINKVYQIVIQDFKKGLFGPVTLDRLLDK